jgi:hypothetical protein
LSSQISNSHIDDFNFLESAGAWSPDSKQFAFSIFSKGRNQMLIIDISTGKTVLQTGMGKVEQFGNLTWSPDGKNIAFSGMVEGQSDIFAYNLESKQIAQLTDDEYSDYAPSYSPDGTMIAFSSDRASVQAGDFNAVHPLNLSIYRIKEKSVQNIDIFVGANNLNAQFSGDSKRVFFLSNRDGFRNLYEYHLESKKINQLTDYFTGISGVTEFSPAISVSRTDDIVYSYYRYQRYTLYHAAYPNFKAKEVNASDIDFTAAILPPKETLGVNIVNSNLANFGRFEQTPSSSLRPVAYRPKFRLDYLANSGAGVSTSRFGTGMQGGVMGIFSDIVGHNQLIANVAINGEIYDFGGMAAYINQASRINWGAAVSHIPYITGFMSYKMYDPNNGNPLSQVDTISTNILRTFENKIEVFGAYPFNKAHRFELGSAFSMYSYRLDRFNSFYQDIGGYPAYYQGSNRERVSNANATNLLGMPLNSFNVVQTNAYFVGDNSIMGIAAPLDGFRYRIGGERYFGGYNFSAISADFRKYFRFKPVTLALRGLTYMRLGRDGENLYPLYAGYGYYIRGYETNSFYNNQNVNSGTFDINQLSGSKMAIMNVELRLPFTGPKKLAQIPSKLLFTDLNLFFDAGVAWTEDTHVVLKSQPSGTNIGYYPGGQPYLRERVPAYSVGASLRVNVLGAMIIEPYVAFPFTRKDIKGQVFGVTFAPGW